VETSQSRATQTVVVLLGVSGTNIGVGERNWGEKYSVRLKKGKIKREIRAARKEQKKGVG